MFNENIFYSIIVPIYNAENYLKGCLDSIKQQTYLNYEVILINDGSTDNTGEICEEFVSQNHEFKVIHTTNKGVSNARNLGLSLAKGEYVLFIDSDDYLTLNALYEVNKILKKQTYDILIFKLATKKGDIINSQKYQLSKLNFCSRDEIKTIIPEIVKKEIINSPIKVYNRHFLSKFNLSFSSQIDLGEDLLFNAYAFSSANKIYFLDKVLYYYVYQNSQSLTQKYDDLKLRKLLFTNDIILKYYNEIYSNSEINEAILYIRMKNIYSYLADLHRKDCSYTIKEKKSIINDIFNMNYFEKIYIIKSWKIRLLKSLLLSRSVVNIYLFSKLMYVYKRYKG